MVLKKIEKHKYEIQCFQNGAVAYQNIRKFYKGPGNLIGMYLHMVFPGLKGDSLKAFKDEIGININDEFLKLLSDVDGFKLFSDSLCLYGFGRVNRGGVYTVSRDASKPMPFHLMDENNGHIEPSKIKIGSVCDDGLYLNNKSGQISRIEKSGSLIESWNSIERCLNELFERLEKEYDSNGICKKPIIINNLVFNRVKSI